MGRYELDFGEATAGIEALQSGDEVRVRPMVVQSSLEQKLFVWIPLSFKSSH